jgi:predicted GNAT superfamily acetyltransferase
MTAGPGAASMDAMTHPMQAQTGADASAVADEAAVVAERAAATAGVRIRELPGLADQATACALFDEIWRPAPDNPPVTAELMRALAGAGGYVAGAFEDEVLVAASAGFCGPPDDRSLHSHIAGVSPQARGRSVGRALKLHQRSWALDRGIARITWTFDPLVRRNAWFNLGRLAATPSAYLTDFYGGMHDAINGDDETDRLLVRWELASASVTAAAAGTRTPEPLPARTEVALVAGPDGGPVARPHTAATVLVGLPDDIEALRRERPVLARAWRLAVREQLGGLLGAGAEVLGHDRTGGYVVRVRAEERDPR